MTSSSKHDGLGVEVTKNKQNEKQKLSSSSLDNFTCVLSS